MSEQEITGIGTPIAELLNSGVVLILGVVLTVMWSKSEVV